MHSQLFVQHLIHLSLEPKLSCQTVCGYGEIFQ
ncbi:unnamed protein product, partial [Allacma fusca]